MENAHTYTIAWTLANMWIWDEWKSTTVVFTVSLLVDSFFYVGCCCELNSIRVTANHSGKKKNHPIVRSWMVVYWRYKRNEPCPMNGHNYSKFCFDNNITGRVSVFGVHFRDYIWQVVHLLFVRSVTTIECSRFFGFSSALQLWFIPVANQATNASVEIISILLSFKNTRSTRFRFQ